VAYEEEKAAKRVETLGYSISLGVAS